MAQFAGQKSIRAGRQHSSKTKNEVGNVDEGLRQGHIFVEIEEADVGQIDSGQTLKTSDPSNPRDEVHLQLPAIGEEEKCA